MAADEISIRNGHQHLTVVLDYVNDRMVFVGEDRKAETIESLFDLSVKGC